MIKKIIALYLVLFTSLSFTQAQGIEFFHGTYDEAMQKAKTEGKLLFVDCYTTWCGPCKMLQANVFPQESVGEFFNPNFVCFKMDCEKEDGLVNCSKLGVTAYPTMFFIDPNTQKVVLKTLGYQVANTLIDRAKTALGGNSNALREMQTKYQAGDRSMPLLLGLTQQLAKSGEDYDFVLKEYLARLTPTEISSESNARLIFELTKTLSSCAYNDFIKLKPNFVESFGAESYARRVEQIANNTVKEASQKKDKQLFLAAMTMLKENDGKRSEEVILKESMRFYLATLDMVSYDQAATKYLKKYKQKDSHLLAEVSAIYVEQVSNPKLLNKALAWTTTSISQEDKYYNNVVLAQLLNKLGKKQEAWVAANKALELGKKENTNYWPAQDLVNKVQIERGSKP